MRVSAPVRTCVGCRTKAGKAELVRIVADAGGRLVIDGRQLLPGRGAYLHPTPECATGALKRRAFGRALRRGDLDAGAVSALAAG